MKTLVGKIPDEKKKPVCGVCPKKKKAQRKAEPEVVEEEEYDLLLEEELGEEEEEILQCLEEDETSCKEMITTRHVLHDVYPVGKKKLPFFGPGAPVSRYENMTPVDLTNDHQYKAAHQATTLEHISALSVTSEPFWKKKPALIATIGPTSSSVADIEAMIDFGMDIARINMAYGDRCCQLNAISNFKIALNNARARMGTRLPVGLMMDLKGTEIRTGKNCRTYSCDDENPRVLLERGSTVKVTTETAFAEKQTPALVYVDFPKFMEYIRSGMKIYIDDGNIILTVKDVKETELTAQVTVEGYLLNYRPVHVPMVPMPESTITNIDAEDIELAIDEEFDFIAVSRLQSAETITDLKGKLIEGLLTARKLREKPIMILAKVSNYQAIKNIDEIIQVSDGIIIQRGDLGLELPPEKIYVAQREIIGKCNLANKPVICSTHLLKSMSKRLVPDRSHVFDIASCIEDGADGICLTKETAIGLYPADTVDQANQIIREAEAADARKYHFQELMGLLKPPIEPIVAISMAACLVANKTKATSIIVVTTSGKAAKLISWFRPKSPIIAVTRFERTAKQLNLWRCILPVVYTGVCIKNNWFENLEYKFQFGITCAKQMGIVRAGDPMVLISGYGRKSAFTNCLRVVYASTEPGIFLGHSTEYYNNIYLQNDCPRTTAKKS